MNKIDSALRRLKDNTYGYCVETGEPIGLKRLIARPIATLSIQAQEKHEQEEKIYVQHRLKEHGAEVWEWFERGAYFYICGDKTYMAKDVHRALIEIAIEHGGLSEEDATHFIEKTMMKEQKRYLRDVY